MEYVKTLKSIIAGNDIVGAINFYLQDEPLTLIVAVFCEEKVKETEAKIEKPRCNQYLIVSILTSMTSMQSYQNQKPARMRLEQTK